MSPAMQLGSAGHTHTGRRKENQDAIRIEQVGEAWLAAVADGMGGHKGGAHASRLALEVVVTALRAGGSIQEAVHKANAVLNEESQDPELQGMGTTMVGVMVKGMRYHVFNVGDSRAYRIRKDEVQQITQDHSFVQEAIRSGTMSASAAAASRWGNALTRSLGGEDQVEVDVFGSFDGTEPEFLVLCSDGVYRTLPESLLGEIVRGTASVEAAAQALVDVAYRRGSDDNLSAVVLEFGVGPRTPNPMELPPSVDEQQGQASAATAVDSPTALSLTPSGEAKPARDALLGQAAVRKSHVGTRAIPLAAITVALVVGLVGWLGWRGGETVAGGPAAGTEVPVVVEPAEDAAADPPLPDSTMPPISEDGLVDGGDLAAPAPEAMR